MQYHVTSLKRVWQPGRYLLLCYPIRYRSIVYFQGSLTITTNQNLLYRAIELATVPIRSVLTLAIVRLNLYFPYILTFILLVLTISPTNVKIRLVHKLGSLPKFEKPTTQETCWYNAEWYHRWEGTRRCSWSEDTSEFRYRIGKAIEFLEEKPQNDLPAFVTRWNIRMRIGLWSLKMLRKITFNT